MAATRLFEEQRTERKPNRRSPLEMRMDILRTVQGGATLPTKIMYGANLTWNAARSDLALLTKCGLLRRVIEGSHGRYELSEQGRRVLDLYHAIVESVR